MTTPIASVLPTVSFTSANTSSLESNGSTTPVTVTATLSNPATTAVIVPIGYAGSAISGSDYTGAPTSITIPVGSSSWTASFSVLNDNTYEPSETVTLVMGTPSGATLGANSTFTHTITNDDSIPTISFNSRDGATSEGNSGSSRFVFVSAQLSNASSADVIVPITYAGSASSGTDYTDASTFITIAAGRTTGTASFAVLGDSAVDPDENVTLTMGTPTGATLGTNITHTHTITDSGVGGGGANSPIVFFNTTSGATSEANSQPVTVTATLSSAAATTVTVQIDYSGASNSDYTLGSGSNLFTFTPGSTTATTSFTVNNDSDVDPNEMVTLTMRSPTGGVSLGNSTYNHTIVDDDGSSSRTVFFTTSTGSSIEGNSDTSAVTVTANLSHAATQAFTVPITYSTPTGVATGYTAGTSLSFTAGSISAQASFTVSGDTTYEPGETVTLTLAPAVSSGYSVGSNSTYTHTIINDDTVVPIVSLTASSAAISEGNGGSSQPVFVTATLDRAATTAVIVPITVDAANSTATLGTDYTAPTSITIAAGKTSGTATFTVLGDATDEISENVTFAMGTPTGAMVAPAAAPLTFTIPDDDMGVAITNTTPTFASDPNYVLAAVAGFDTLDLSAVSSTSSTTPIYVLADYGVQVDNNFYNISGAVGAPAFDRFVTNNAGGTIFRGSQTVSEVVQLKATSSNDIRLDNRADTDLAAETDVVDYSATSAAVTVNLGVTTTDPVDGNWVYATASKATTIVTTDKISGAEGIIGSTGNDVITGNARSNLLVGGAGNDTLDGGAGNDVLIGGVGSGAGVTDVLIGGIGKDVLIDLDGATLRGSDTAKTQSAAGENDVFVVRTGATIENYHVARDGAGLAGRAFSSTNDTIVFNLSLVALTSSLGDLRSAIAATQMPLMGSQLQDVLENIRRDIDIRVVPITIEGDTTANDWVAIASYNGSWLSSDQTTVELARVVLKDMTTIPNGSVLTDVALPDFSVNSPQNLAYFEKIDSLVFNQVSDLLVEDEAINIGFVLEAVRAGTVREVAPGPGNVMFGDFNINERIFNPGVGDQKIFGSNKKDTYEFLVQDLKTNAGAPTQNAGNDRILDTGGDDAVAFSNITLDTIATLNFDAIRFGREAGNYTLKSNYSQTDGTITNSGSFTWLGHFREGFGMGLEQIKLGTTTLEMADVRYEAGSKTPSQVASGGLDTVMVGGAGDSEAVSKFVVEKNAGGVGADLKQNLYLWDAEARDVIDLKAFFADETLAITAVQKSATSRSTFTIDLDATQDLVLNFMDTTLTQESLEMMIARAYS